MEFRDNQAIYLQIADYFCEKILLKKWQSGEKIPSVRELAVDIEVNPNTVVRTYNFLQEKEIIFNKRGIGYFVAEDGFEKTRDFKKSTFIEQDLPAVFKTIRLLNIDIEEVKTMFLDGLSPNGLGNSANA